MSFTYFFFVYIYYVNIPQHIGMTSIK